MAFTSDFMSINNMDPSLRIAIHIASYHINMIYQIPKKKQRIWKDESLDYSLIFNQEIPWTVMLFLSFSKLQRFSWKSWNLYCDVYLINASLCFLFDVCVSVYMHAFVFMCISAGSAAFRAPEWSVISLCFGWDTQTGETHICRHIRKHLLIYICRHILKYLTALV